MNPQEEVANLVFLKDLRKKYSHQPVFLQSVDEIALSLLPLFEDPDKGDFYRRAFAAMTEPERIIAFRVPWEDDKGNLHFNRGWRVEFSRYVQGKFKNWISHNCLDETAYTHLVFVLLVSVS